ncbi:MAG: hypothetical protein H0V96_09390 [Acidimicrobiia bacterium]|nr:hypothetical protein [Acidimicrobiia bacterium]
MANDQQAGTPVDSVDTGESTPTRVAETAGAEASNVASTAVDGARDVADEVTTQAKAVAGEAKDQLASLVSQGRQEVRQQAEQRTAQFVGQLRSLSEQVTALAEGRPDTGGSLVGYLNEAQNRIRGLASRLEQGGPQGLVDDVTRFARRRPGVFLTGAVAAGFVVGRALRAGVASQQDADPAGAQRPAVADVPVGSGQTQRGSSLPPADTGWRQ